MNESHFKEIHKYKRFLKLILIENGKLKSERDELLYLNKKLNKELNIQRERPTIKVYNRKIFKEIKREELYKQHINKISNLENKRKQDKKTINNLIEKNLKLNKKLQIYENYN